MAACENVPAWRRPAAACITDFMGHVVLAFTIMLAILALGGKATENF